MIHYASDPRQMEIHCRADIVAEEPLVGLIDEIVGRLELGSLYSRHSESGRAFYDPAMQLKVLFFGYCDGVRSCRELAKHIRYDLRYRYFCGSLRPDFRTINRFRKDNLDLLGGYFAHLVMFCQESGVLDASVLALDGTKLRASSSGRSLKKTRDRLSRHFRDQLRADSAADGVVEELPSSDASSGDGGAVRGSDPDARFMKTGEGGKRLSYNAQAVVDGHQIIVAADVSTNADDSVSFRPMVERCRDVLGDALGTLVADGGYYSGRNIAYASERGLDAYLPVARSGRVPDAAFHRDKFVYDGVNDRYRCPAGQWLCYRSTRTRHGIRRRHYAGCAASCGRCCLRSRCTTARYRTLEISEYYWQERQMTAKLQTPAGRAIYRRRQALVEPVFGNLKFNLGFGRFHVRTLQKVRGEFFLMCIAHNLKKLLSLRPHIRPFGGVSMILKRIFYRINGIWDGYTLHDRDYAVKSILLSPSW